MKPDAKKIKKKRINLKHPSYNVVRAQALELVDGAMKNLEDVSVYPRLFRIGSGANKVQRAINQLGQCKELLVP
jgi:hypothetical protein